MKNFVCVLLIILILICVSSCGNTNTPPLISDFLPMDNGEAFSAATTVAPPPDTTVPATEPPAPVLPDICFFLDDLSKNYSVINSYKNAWIYGKDVGCFGVIPSVNVESPKSYSDFWNKAYSEYSELSAYRLGYLLEFSVNNGESYSITILSPKDAEGGYNEYIEVYLYDDVHQQPGQFYSHLLEYQMNENTLITSAKLTGGAKVGEVNKISLSAFLYKGEEDIGTNGIYTGDLAVVLPIEKIG